MTKQIQDVTPVQETVGDMDLAALAAETGMTEETLGMVRSMPVSVLKALMEKARADAKAAEAAKKSKPRFAFLVVMATPDGSENLIRWQGAADTEADALADCIAYAESKSTDEALFLGKEYICKRPVPNPKGRKPKAD